MIIMRVLSDLNLKLYTDKKEINNGVQNEE
jgi:hypothetical protein